MLIQVFFKPNHVCHIIDIKTSSLPWVPDHPRIATTKSLDCNRPKRTMGYL